MKRQEVLNAYTVHNGIITQAGIFAGEPVYAPHFHEMLVLEQSSTMDVLDADREEFPELGHARSITVTDDGDCVTTELHGANNEHQNQTLSP